MSRSLAKVLGAGLVTKAPMTPTTFAPVSSTLFGWIRESFAGAWQRNIEVDNTTQLTAHSAVYSCIVRIAYDIANLRIRLVEQTSDDIWVEAPRSSPYWQVLRKPNLYQNRIQFLVHWLCSKLIHGNTYGIKIRDQRGIVTRTHLIDPRRVLPLVTEMGDVYYQISSDTLAGQPHGITLPASEVFHDRCATLFHALVGVGPLYASAVAATQGNRIQNNSATFFQNMSRPSGMLTGPGKIQPETAARLKTSFEQNYSGENLGRLFVAGDGLEYTALTIPPEQAQLVEQFGMTVADVARAFGVPLYKIGAGPMPTNNNVQALQQQYYNDTLKTHMQAIELCLEEGMGIGLGTPTGEGKILGVDFDLDDLLRMDSMTMAEVIDKLSKSGTLAPNEGRRLINKPPVKGGESPLVQEQNYSLQALAKRDAKEDPFASDKPAAAPTPAPAAPEPEVKPPSDDKAAVIEQARAAAADVVEKALDRARADGAQVISDALAQAQAAEQRAAVAAQQVQELAQRLSAVEKPPEPVDEVKQIEDLAGALAARFAELEPLDVA